MSAAYSAADWSDMFVATAGAAAALAGLLFVAVSINVDRILAFAGLPERALEALLILVGAISLIAASGGGLYWVLGGIVGAFAGTVLNAWLLLIEILR